MENWVEEEDARVISLNMFFREQVRSALEKITA